MATALHHLSDEDIANVPDASNMCFGIVVAEWNKEITDALLNGAVTTLEKYGTLPENIHVKTVPGSFELIYGAQQMTKNDGFDAVIILGSVIRGETPHFDYICQGVHLRHSTAQLQPEHPRHLRTAYHQRLAASQG